LIQLKASKPAGESGDGFSIEAGTIESFFSGKGFEISFQYFQIPKNLLTFTHKGINNLPNEYFYGNRFRAVIRFSIQALKIT
jgi:hypothetical protein